MGAPALYCLGEGKFNSSGAKAHSRESSNVGAETRIPGALTKVQSGPPEKAGPTKAREAQDVDPLRQGKLKARRYKTVRGKTRRVRSFDPAKRAGSKDDKLPSWSLVIGLWSEGQGVQIVSQPLLTGIVGGLLDHEEDDGFEEAGISGQCGAVTCSEGGFHRLLGGGSYEFETADKDACGVCGCGVDGEGKNGIDEGAGQDVDEARTFFEPGTLPGFEHGVSFVRVKALRDEHAFEIAEEGIERAFECGRSKRGLVLERAEDAITDVVAATLEKDYLGDFFVEVILYEH